MHLFHSTQELRILSEFFSLQICRQIIILTIMERKWSCEVLRYKNASLACLCYLQVALKDFQLLSRWWEMSVAAFLYFCVHKDTDKHVSLQALASLENALRLPRLGCGASSCYHCYWRRSIIYDTMSRNPTTRRPCTQQLQLQRTTLPDPHLSVCA